MAKTAQQKLNEFFSECDAIRAALRAFQEGAYDEYGSHSYAAGYLESSLVDVIMQLPKHKRAEMRQTFEQKAQSFGKKVVDKQTA